MPRCGFRIAAVHAARSIYIGAMTGSRDRAADHLGLLDGSCWLKTEDVAVSKCRIAGGRSLVLVCGFALDATRGFSVVPASACRFIMGAFRLAPGAMRVTNRARRKRDLIDVHLV
jgi:hypothetical protein